MKKRSLAGISALAALGLFSSLPVHALGLGQIEVYSALNEPFRAEIPITALRDDERGSIQARLGSAQEFDRAGLDRSFVLMQLQFDVIERDGQPRILISSQRPIREPFLDFLLMATAGDGRILREYTVLLDPPKQVLSQTAAPAVRAPATTTPIPAVRPVPAPQQPSTPVSSKLRGSSYGPVDRAETLWAIALQTRPNTSISVHQMMMALLEANPQAFTNNNVNGLKAGQTLTIPSMAEIQTNWPQQRAVSAFAEQETQWRNRNQPVVNVVQQPEPVSETTAAAAMADAEVDAETPASSESAEQPAATDTAETLPDARLQLVAATDEQSPDTELSSPLGDPQLRQLTEQLTMAQETIEAQTQENIDFKARMDAMEAQLETMRRMIAIKDADLARLQSIVESSDDSADAETLTEETLAQFAADSDTPATANGSEPAAPSAAQQQVADDLISQTAELLNLDSDEVRGVVDRVRAFVADNKLEVMLGALLILLILWLLARRRRKEMTWNEAMANIGNNNNDPAQVYSDDLPVSPSNSAPEVSEMDTDEQPRPRSVAELMEQADMFVGYADYVQARSALEQARLQEPADLTVAYKLLFVLFKQNKPNEFVQLVEQAAFDESSDEWRDICEWGRQLAPHQAMFKPSDELSEAKTPQSLESTDSVTADEQPLAEATELTQQSDHIEFDLDAFKIDQSEPDVETEQVTSNESLQFDSRLDLDETVADDTVEPPLNLEADTGQDDALRLDIAETDLSSDVDESVSSTEPEPVDDLSLDFTDGLAAADAPDLEFDLDAFDAIDEAETKLDLAAAYIDMEDPQGAASILEEVLREGNDEQKARAQQLLDSLS